MSGRLEGKTAFITGASSGVGRAIALRYAAEGANVCCTDLDPHPRTLRTDDPVPDAIDVRATTSTPTHEAISTTYGQDHAAFTMVDVTSSSSVEAGIKFCVEKFGRLDITVASAGVALESFNSRPLKCHETPEAIWDKELDINAKGVFLTCKFGLAQMLRQEPLPGQDRGWVINLASIMGFVAIPGIVSYCASKGAVVQMTKQMAVDYAEDKIHVNCLCPGFVKTSMTQNVHGSAANLAWSDSAHPFGGMGEPDYVAKAAVFLASDDAAWVTGVPLPVDGGYLVR
ncbi:NAD(P)-binding protein [Myriangium duriaei CBS 260.36]|uniref:NAD(P)-binding protein n=1 Tax=Myriangium duriaei CBS 260.36 TaxID=1168546 RepID=A0A9P4MP38_9PEZI|nr:NAD(P)-binding protein [Myriangium duriaei CBS 260.36]